jgi:CHAT domain
MSTSISGVPLALKLKRDVTDGFRELDDCQPGEYKLDRDGLIQVNRDSNEDGQEIFQILLEGPPFRERGMPYRRPTAATINLSVAALFTVVQTCRKRWEEAIASAQRTIPGADSVGRTHYAYEEQWDNPVDAATFRTIGAKLAVAGARMFKSVFESNLDTPLDDVARKLREAASSGEHVLTVDAADFHLPWRMLYTHPFDEDLADDGSNFDPRGFWGFQHIFEQFTNRRSPKNHVTAKKGKLALSAALHAKIDKEFGVACIERHRDFIRNSGDRLAYVEWTNKADVTSGLSRQPFQQQVVYFLCHAEGAGTTDKPRLQPPVLQLMDGTVDPVELREAINHRFKGSPPLVFINACRGAQLATLVTHNFTFATEFLQQGAVCFIGPQIEVPAVFAGEFGKCFFERLMAKSNSPPLVGVILRDLTRYMWERNNPFGLVYSLYAFADCHILWEEEVSPWRL